MTSSAGLTTLLSMIDACPDCSTPKVRGRCPSCPATRNWYAFVLTILTLVLAFKACTAQAETPIPPCAWTPAAQRELGKMVQLETCSEDEYRTIGWALARRWRGRPAVRHLTFSESVTAFSHILRRHREALLVFGPPLAARRVGCSPRQRMILGTGIPESVRTKLEEWATGGVDDGCIGGKAYNWRAPTGHRHGIRCPGYNEYFKMPIDVVLEEGRCG